MVVAYAAFVGLLLASYAAPISGVIQSRAEIPQLEARLGDLEDEVSARSSEVEELQTPAGIERAARERYGMASPGEKIYLVPEPEVER